MDSYRDRIVLVTGGNSGIGKAFVARFVAAGAKVIACGRNEATLQALKAAHPGVEAKRCDIASHSERHALVEWVSQQCGRLDVLVNNAGVMEQVDVLSANVDDAAITREIAINLTAPIMLTRQSLPLLKRGTQPLILMVTSGYALLPTRRAPTYSATKAGLRAFTQALRYQLENTGIRVVEVLPPLVDTPVTAAIQKPKMSPEAVVEATLRAVARGQDEVLIGQVRLLPLLNGQDSSAASGSLSVTAVHRRPLFMPGSMMIRPYVKPGLARILTLFLRSDSKPVTRRMIGTTLSRTAWRITLLSLRVVHLAPFGYT